MFNLRNSEPIYNIPIQSRVIDNQHRVVTSSVPYLYEVAEGNVVDHSVWDKYGMNEDVDSAAEEDIWSVGGSYVWPTSAMQMEVISSSAEDDPDKGGAVAGTGVHKVRIYYLDSTFTEKTEDIFVNGTAAVATVATDIYRINRIRPLVVGTGLKAAGNIDVRNLADTPIYTRMPVGLTKARQLIYTVPKNKTLYITRMNGSIGGTTSPKFGRFIIRSTYDDVTLTRNAWFTAYAEIGASSQFFSLPFDTPLSFPAGSDILVSCKTLDDNCYVTASLRGWIEI